ncbi:hypothetical protein M378DRAFT_165640, partial [Amanita muscaria Koide BX008]
LISSFTGKHLSGSRIGPIWIPECMRFIFTMQDDEFLTGNDFHQIGMDFTGRKR